MSNRCGASSEEGWVGTGMKVEWISGSHEALEKLLELYVPLIDKHSRVNGQIDEDLRQYILIHIALNISKFTI